MSPETKSDEDCGREALRRPLRERDLDAARRLLNATQLDTALQIDAKMRVLLSKGSDEIAVLSRMFDHMEGFKRLIDTAPRDGLDLVTTRFAGFFLFAKLLEGLAGDIASGAIKVPPDH